MKPGRVFLNKNTSALVIIWAPASLAAFSMAEDTAPIPPSTYLQWLSLSDVSFSLTRGYTVKPIFHMEEIKEEFIRPH